MALLSWFRFRVEKIKTRLRLEAKATVNLSQVRIKTGRRLPAARWMDRDCHVRFWHCFGVFFLAMVPSVIAIFPRGLVVFELTIIIVLVGANSHEFARIRTNSPARRWRSVCMNRQYSKQVFK